MIADALGQRFVESIPLNLEAAWAESRVNTPLICLLSPGALSHLCLGFLSWHGHCHSLPPAWRRSASMALKLHRRHEWSNKLLASSCPGGMSGQTSCWLLQWRLKTEHASPYAAPGPGADPLKLIEDLAKRKKIKTLVVSMGQGQEIIARRYMATAAADGQWVLLQNTHLSLAYLSEARRPLA